MEKNEYLKLSPDGVKSISHRAGGYGMVSLDPEHWKYIIVWIPFGLILSVISFIYIGIWTQELALGQAGWAISGLVSAIPVFYPLIIHPLLELYRTEYRIFEDRIEKETGALIMKTKIYSSKRVTDIETKYPHDRYGKKTGRIIIKLNRDEKIILRGINDPEDRVSDIRNILGI